MLMASLSGSYVVRFSFMQALRLLSITHDLMLFLMFSRCEKDCSHAHVEPSIVSRAILMLLCVVCDRKRSMFRQPAGRRVEVFAANSACRRASLSKSSFSDLNLFSHMSKAFSSGACSSKPLMETPGMELRWALTTALAWTGDEIKKTSELTKFSKAYFE